MRRIFLTVAGFLLPGVWTSHEDSLFQPIYSWKTVDYDFPESADRLAQQVEGSYKPSNIAITDMDFWPGGEGQRMFVTTPRFQEGTPATLSTVSALQHDGQSLLTPYPDWDWHRPGACEGICSAHRIKIDKCGRLWVLDSGVVNILNKRTRVCQPQVLVFDLNTDHLINRYNIPEDCLSPNSLLVNLELDCRDLVTCFDTFVYIADSGANRLLVLDSSIGSVWQVNSPYFYPYPLAGIFNTPSGNFSVMHGVTALALGPVDSDNDRLLFFHSLASVRESCIKTSLLRDSSLFVKGYQSCLPESFHVSQPVRSCQAVCEVMTEKGVMFYGKLHHGIGCWHWRKPFVKENLITLPHDKNILEVQSEIKVHDGCLWVLTTNMAAFLMGKIQEDKINFTVLKADIAALTNGTSCHC